MGVLAIVVAVTNGVCAVILNPEQWLITLGLAGSVGFVFAGLQALVVPSVEEGAPESSREKGRGIVLVAQVMGTILLGWTLLHRQDHQFASALPMGLALMSGLLAFGLAMHAFPRAYASFTPIPDEKIAEPEPDLEAPPTPANPDLHRYSHVLQKLRSRGYR